MSRFLRITGNIIKGTVFAVVFSVIALLIWRMVTSGPPKSLDPLLPNEELKAAYEKDGNELYMFKQDIQSITTADRNRGYFAVTECVFIPEANQIQLIFRYNNSTVRALAKDKGLSEVPSLDAELFDVTLTLQTDRTPEIKDDNAGLDKSTVEYTRLKPTQVERERKNLYNFYRYVFDVSELDKGTLTEMLENDLLLAVYADVYYVEEINYDELSYGSLCVYEYKADKIKVRLSSADKKAINNFTEAA
jgi:hypothetical protein